MITLRFILKFIFFFPGTFLHELAHYVAALVLGRAEGFSVRPRIEGGNFVFGSVKSGTRFKVLSSFIALAPVIWWFVLVLILGHLSLIRTDDGMPAINAGVILTRLKTFTYKDALYFWLLLQLLWAGRPSLQDIKNFIGGLFSVSGIMLVSAAAAVIYIVRRFVLSP